MLLYYKNETVEEVFSYLILIFKRIKVLIRLSICILLS